MTTPDEIPPGRTITLRVNGTEHTVEIEDRDLLVDVIRRRLRLTGTHLGCRNGDCGSCTITLNGRIVKSCLLFAASVDGAEITTIEGFAGDRELDPIQEAFWAEDGFQCGYCLPGQLFAARQLLDRDPDPDEKAIRAALSGNICRCTGYVNMVKAVRAAAERRRA
ncbi:(2Fe-2S)-binding protein [Nocardia terpenica]|uniref:(2Fe-2S)-binding protein n=1 Tax=Nocardia terpenica TaxID=455432 RepID=UPI001895449A|nr:(2Fe-2S)-binding protein [Nocardia terpenica]MBF6065902.1 (2Fe-2S)-binding protein [Nocardia terpenica]MBF6108902.1 (2Fe-2S)-binding protein [Nocardia terpenica]MBF6116146.1 (2Fe-2S)-binding protein [Nocardia terpenica]MBF6123147.1 (2Fe-2S)-binding protein [Nocardia terpenica]MBF6153171.1 (2Fe-2S)-binding protein [Nocardia terpenica]